MTYEGIDLSALANDPIRNGKRASKVWLPLGKRSGVSPEAKAAERERRALQIDLEDAVEAAGGTRGCLRTA